LPSKLNQDRRHHIPKVAIVSESGLYHLILTSRKPQAKAFRRWVTGTVLPSLRKTGEYQTKDDARTVETDGNGRQDGVTVALPGPGRYVATVLPDGALHLHETEYSAVLEDMNPDGIQDPLPHRLRLHRRSCPDANGGADEHDKDRDAGWH